MGGYLDSVSSSLSGSCLMGPARRKTGTAEVLSEAVAAEASRIRSSPSSGAWLGPLIKELYLMSEPRRVGKEGGGDMVKTQLNDL